MSFSKLVAKELPSLTKADLKIIQEVYNEATKETKGKPRGGLTGYHMFLRDAKEQGTSHADALALWQGMSLEEKKEFKVDPDAVLEPKKSKGTNNYKEFTNNWREEEKKK